MTHNLTHTGKEAGGDSGADRTERIIFVEQKGLETAKYQWLLGFLSLGKDEVSSSNLVSSSRKRGQKRFLVKKLRDFKTSEALG